MLLALVTTAMMLPFFWSLYADDTGTIQRYQMRLSVAATIVANVSGFLHGGLYALLRFTRLGKPVSGSYVEFDKHRSARGGSLSTPRSSIYIKHLEQPIYVKQLEKPIHIIHLEQPVRSEQMDQPISPPWLEQPRHDLERDRDERNEKMLARHTASTARRQSLAVPQIMSPEMVREAGRDEDSNNGFPTGQGAPTTADLSHRLPAGAHDMSADELLVPAAAWAGRRERKSSLEESATVQIALRVSNINDMPPVTSPIQEAVDPDSSANPFADDASWCSASVHDDGAVASGQGPPLPPASEAMTLSPDVYDPGHPTARGNRERGSPTMAPPSLDRSRAEPRRVASGQWF